MVLGVRLDVLAGDDGVDGLAEPTRAGADAVGVAVDAATGLDADVDATAVG